MKEFVLFTFQSTLGNMKLGLLVACAVFVSLEAKVEHRDIGFTMCSDTESEDMYELDGEEKAHADFNKKKLVMTLPEFADQFSYVEGAYEAAEASREVCRSNLDNSKKANKYPAEPMDPPEMSVYSRDDVQLDSENTLICSIRGFYPPHVEVSWTKNNEEVTSEVSLSQYQITSDGNFNLMSSLSFTPAEGDIYTCTVNHTALQTPMTKIWEVDVAQPSVGPSVFCGVGLVAGLLGVATGTFFLIKGNNCN